MNYLEAQVKAAMVMESLKDDIRQTGAELYEDNGMVLFPYIGENGGLAPYPVFRLVTRNGDKYCQWVESLPDQDLNTEEIRRVVLDIASEFKKYREEKLGWK